MVMLRDTDGRSVEAVGRRKDGTTFWANVTITALRDDAAGAGNHR